MLFCNYAISNCNNSKLFKIFGPDDRNFEFDMPNIQIIYLSRVENINLVGNNYIYL